MGLISPIDKNARDVTSTTTCLGELAYLFLYRFFFFLIFMLFAFVFGAFAVFSLRIHVGWAICESL